MTDLNKAVTRRTRANVPFHGMKNEIVVTLYPGGTIGLRESGRRRKSEYFLDLGDLYFRAVRNKVAVERMTKGKKCANERKLRKLLK